MLRRGWFTNLAWSGAHQAATLLSALHPDFEALITNVPRLLTVDFSSLRQPRVHFDSQLTISKSRVSLLAACAVHYNLDFGLVTRYLGGEYMALHRDPSAIINRVRGLISDDDLNHIHRVLTIGCPAHFNYEESAANKEAFLRRAYHASLASSKEVVDKTLNKEERNSHIIPFPWYLVRASPVAHHVPQVLLQREGKKDCLVWDGSTKLTPHDVVMNDITPTDFEPEITFGLVYMAFITWIWKLRILFPREDIFLAFVDISSCFRWPRIFPCLVGAFGFIIGPLFYVANAMVFGSVSSASSWEPFRRAIAVLASSYGHSPQIVRQYQDLLSHTNLALPEVVSDGSPIVTAIACSKNQGISHTTPTQHFIYMDDDLMADTQSRIPFALANIIHSIYNILGWPEPTLRPCPLALDKWLLLRLRTRQVLLGLVFDTRHMTIEIDDEYRLQTFTMLRSTWHKHQESFTIKEVELLIGKLARIGHAFRPMYHLLPHLYASVAYAL